ncbi:MAG: glycoside hydrolase family 31 protein [Leptospiraceae bacterium]|nr:glycoside hydrolase family 31 protein [Leptospiraceae bacterium]MDW7975392.1 glycoside hydrolase family 31 protein [Leptospiraceae bacterium]
MNREHQENFKKIIQIHNYEKQVYRFSFFGRENLESTPILSKETEIPVFKDAEGKITAKKKSFLFMYDPPTRNIRIDIENKTLLMGIIKNEEEQFLQFSLYDEVNIYGMGAINGNYIHKNGRYILRNIDTMFYLLKNQPYASFPVLFFRRKFSQKHFAVLFYTPYPLEIVINSQQHHPIKYEILVSYYHKRETEIIDFLILIGTPEEILTNMMKLLGQPFLPPIWALGYHQSRWSYKTQKKVLEVAQEAQKHEVPLDAIYLDIHHMDRYRVFTWNKKRFPDPKTMIETLKQKGIRLVAITNPGIAIDPQNPLYQESTKNDYFCKSEQSYYQAKLWAGNVHLVDFTDEKAREWWKQRLKDHLELGMAGIWNDMNEPVLKLGTTIEPLKESLSHKLGSHLRYRNQYANFEAETTFKAFEEHNPENRPFILTRSGTIGIHKWAFLWTGDNHTSWEHLRENLYMVMNLTLSGVYYVGADIGGFGAPRKGVLSIFKFFRNPELFERWVELGSLLPFFRNHTVLFSYSQEPWKFPNATLQRVKKHIRRRYQLLFYLYYLFYEAHQKGKPIVRPIFYEHGELSEEDENLKNQFFLGNNLLACPVLLPSISNINVYLPPGNWFEFESAKIYHGNRWLNFPVQRGYYPLFIRAGSAIPMAIPRKNTEETLQSNLIFEIYPDAKIEGFVYIDDGISNQYKSKHFLAKIEGKRENNNNILLKYEILNSTHQPQGEVLKLRLPLSYTTMIYNKKKKSCVVRHLENEDRNFSVSEFELPLLENWEAQFVI